VGGYGVLRVGGVYGAGDDHAAYQAHIFAFHKTKDAWGIQPPDGFARLRHAFNHIILVEEPVNPIRAQRAHVGQTDGQKQERNRDHV
jgi:hypothetical protein